jgi:hypothetical protein
MNHIREKKRNHSRKKRKRKIIQEMATRKTCAAALAAHGAGHKFEPDISFQMVDNPYIFMLQFTSKAS